MRSPVEVEVQKAQLENTLVVPQQVPHPAPFPIPFSQHAIPPSICCAPLVFQDHWSPPPLWIPPLSGFPTSLCVMSKTKQLRVCLCFFIVHKAESLLTSLQPYLVMSSDAMQGGRSGVTLFVESITFVFRPACLYLGVVWNKFATWNTGNYQYIIYKHTNCLHFSKGSILASNLSSNYIIV